MELLIKTAMSMTPLSVDKIMTRFTPGPYVAPFPQSSPSPPVQGVHPYPGHQGTYPPHIMVYQVGHPRPSSDL